MTWPTERGTGPSFTFAAGEAPPAGAGRAPAEA